MGRDTRGGKVTDGSPLGREWTFGGVYVGDLDEFVSLRSASIGSRKA